MEKKYNHNYCRICRKTPAFAPFYCELHFARYDPKQYVRALVFLKYGKNKCRQCQRYKMLLPVERHHPNYTKPYDFISLCKGCHIEADKERDKSFDDKLGEYLYNQIKNKQNKQSDND